MLSTSQELSKGFVTWVKNEHLHMLCHVELGAFLLKNPIDGSVCHSSPLHVAGHRSLQVGRSGTLHPGLGQWGTEFSWGRK